MERKLVAATLALLFMQVFLLVADVDFELLGGFSRFDHEPFEEIGVITAKTQNVKRRNQGSVIWEESEKKDSLLSFDSVLTLENSSAQLQLKDDIKINLHENTLIVLEPAEIENKDSLRIHFSRGLFLSENKVRRMQVGSGEWQLEAHSGTSMSLKTLENDQVEVEVTAGAVDVKNKTDASKSTQISQGTRFTLSKNKMGDQEQLAADLKFIGRDEERVYAHHFPITFWARWEGSAQKLRVIGPNKKIENHVVEITQRQIALSLMPGTYSLSLSGKDGVSNEIFARALQAPMIRYMMPLPRDRFTLGQDVFFSWLPVANSVSYEIELTNERSERIIYAAPTVGHKITPDMEGPLQMRVFARDERGFRIPPRYSQPLYVLRDPLAPPRLQEPKLRAPASPERKSIEPEKQPAQPRKRKSETSLWRRLWGLLINEAHADAAPVKEVRFHWYPVTGADFYTIEISSNADFQKPEVMTNVSEEKFQWSGFKKQIYHWRVAAGSNSGRMGLFSETAIVDLSHIDVIDSGEIATGVDVVAVAAKPLPVPQHHAPQSPSDKISGEISAPKHIENQPAPERMTDRQFFAEFNLHHLYFSQETEFSAALSGFANASANLGARLTTENGSYTVVTRYAKIDWIPEDPDVLPYQDQLSTQSFSLSGLFLKNGRDMSYGFHLEYLPLLQRIDLENLASRGVVLGGPLLGFKTMINERLNFQSTGGLLYGQQIFAVHASNQINYKLKQIDHLYFGGDLDFNLFFGPESLSAFALTTGLHFGLDW